MTITFTFAINWSGDGVTWIDESANVLSSHLQLGMHDRYEGH